MATHDDKPNPYRVWLGLDADAPRNHYELLGLPPGETGVEKIRHAFRQRYAEIRKLELGAHGEMARRILGELSQAVDCLTDAATKAAATPQRQEQRPCCSTWARPRGPARLALRRLAQETIRPAPAAGSQSISAIG
jgi:hypothetical protein